MTGKNKRTGKAQSSAKPKDGKKPTARLSITKNKANPHHSTNKKDENIDLRAISRQLASLDRNLEKLGQNVKDLKDESRANNKRLKSLEAKLETRIKREDLIMDTLGLNSRSKKGGKSKIRELNSSLIKSQEYLLNTGNRIDNILSAIKNHREFLVKLNRRVYKVNAKEIIELQIDVISNSLTVMMLTGFDFDKSLLRDVDKLKKMLEAKEFELAKVKKKMNSLDKKFEEELERFDFKSIYEKKQDIPGYH